MHTARLMFIQNRNNSLKQVYVPFIKALISHIKDRLPDPGIFAAFSILDPGKLPSSQEEMVSQKYGEAHIDALEKLYGQGAGAIVNSVTIKGEWFELRLYLSIYFRALSMAEVLKLLTTEDSSIQPSFCEDSAIISFTGIGKSVLESGKTPIKEKAKNEKVC